VWRGQAVAVKLVECQQGSRQAQDALNEAALSEQFDHPNIIKVGFL